jgi:U3 small nucleolar RNA-associated protein MPP10
MYDDEEEDDNEESMDPSTMRYEDFYVNELQKSKASANGKESKKRVAINIDETSEEEDEEGNFDMEDENDDYVESDEEGEDDYGRSRQISQAMSSKKSRHLSVNKDNKNKPAEFTTSYQRRLLELGTQIQELEQELIAEKSWEMRGEVAAQHRPENSLLDVAVDVDRATKVAPVITQEYTSTLEDLIINRIEDSKFDDPKPRNAMAEVLTAEPGDDKDPIELSQEKSKLGLAEIYAEDFAKKMLNSDEKLSVEVQALREEVVGLFGAVSHHLDALCHFYFTPRPVAGETSAKVLATQRSLPALEMEDVTPYSVQSDAAKLAPEELLTKKKGPRIMLLSSEELGRDDRKKRRRVQKEFNRKEHRRADAQLDENVKRARREEEVLSKDKRVSVDESSQERKTKNHNETGEFSKSSMFFSNLQKDVEAGVKSQQQAQKSTKISAHNVTASASAYKL